jgi:hypothetical protein
LMMFTLVFIIAQPSSLRTVGVSFAKSNGINTEKSTKIN